ncbi:hypothetical protein ACFE04_021837 [Oxalis oulophora]
MSAGFSASPIPIPTRLISPTPSVQLSSRHLFPKALHKQIPSPEQDVGDQDSDQDDDVSDEEHVDVSDEDSPPNSPNSTNNLKDNSHIPSEHGSRIEEASKHPKNFITIGDDLNDVQAHLLFNNYVSELPGKNCAGNLVDVLRDAESILEEIICYKIG